MPLQTVSTLIGVAKQSVKGTIAANPTFAHGLSGGAPISVEPSQSPVEVTVGKRAAYNMYRESVAAGAGVQAPAYIRSLGLYLLGALGTDTVTGASAPYTHTYSTGDLPYLTFFTKGMGATIQAVRDCKIDELSLKWDSSKPVEVTVKAMGTVFSYPASFTPTTDETGVESFLVPVGGTFQYDLIGSTNASARIVGGELTIKNNISALDPSSSVEADDVWEGIQEHTVKLTVIPDDLNDFRKVITGAAAGTAVSSTVPVGSLNLQFKENAGTGTLSVTGSKVAYLTSFPDADPKGGAVQIELAGQAMMPAAGTAPLVYALVNSQASY